MQDMHNIILASLASVQERQPCRSFSLLLHSEWHTASLGSLANVPKAPCHPQTCFCWRPRRRRKSLCNHSCHLNCAWSKEMIIALLRLGSSWRGLHWDGRIFLYCLHLMVQPSFLASSTLRSTLEWNHVKFIDFFWEGKVHLLWNACRWCFSAPRFIDGCYTPLAIDRLCEEIADSGGEVPHWKWANGGVKEMTWILWNRKLSLSLYIWYNKPICRSSSYNLCLTCWEPDACENRVKTGATLQNMKQVTKSVCEASSWDHSFHPLVPLGCCVMLKPARGR